MKKLVALLIFLISAIALNAQTQDPVKQPNWFERVFLGQSVVVHDTVYIIVHDYEDEEECDEDEEETSGSIGLPIDTLSTNDKFLKVILFDNGSWVYYDIPKPELPDFISNDHWMTDQVHAYFDVNVKDLPEELELT